MDDETWFVQPSTAGDVTDEMRHFSTTFLSSLPAVDGFTLKSRSPSCGIKDVKIYSSTANPAVLEKGGGLFGVLVYNRYSNTAVEISDSGKGRDL